jgi:hypothetical protein
MLLLLLLLLPKLNLCRQQMRLLQGPAAYQIWHVCCLSIVLLLLAAVGVGSLPPAFIIQTNALVPAVPASRQL